MANFETVAANLTALGFSVKTFSTGAEAAAYLNQAIDQTTVGIGGSGTIQNLGLYELLEQHNTVYWHWKQEPNAARESAATAEVYLTSANALAESGELVNIDGNGNRVASTLYGHKRLYFVIGRNKLVPTYEDAVWRARNVAAPQRAKQLNRKTPCAVLGDHCYNCKSPERVCRGMVTLWAPITGMDVEVILIDEDYGL